MDALATAAAEVVTDRITGQRELAKSPLSAPQRHHEDERRLSLFDDG